MEKQYGIQSNYFLDIEEEIEGMKVIRVENTIQEKTLKIFLKGCITGEIYRAYIDIISESEIQLVDLFKEM